MSEEGQGSSTPNTGEGNQPDPINNVKAEFGRKMGNIEAQLAELANTTKSLMDKIQPKAPVQEESDDELLYSKPAEFKKKLVDTVETKVSQIIEHQNRAANERQQTLAALVREFPELNQADTELHTETLKALESLPKELQASPYGYRTAVYQAAATLGVQPKSKRKPTPKENADDFSFSGSRSNAPKKQKAELDPKLLMTAELMGIDITNEKEIEELKKHSGKKISRFE